MSTAVADKPKADEAKPAEARRIKHPQDRAALVGMLAKFGGDIEDAKLVDEYFEYREVFGHGFGNAPGQMDRATLLELAIRHKRRLKK